MLRAYIDIFQLNGYSTCILLEQELSVTKLSQGQEHDNGHIKVMNEYVDSRKGYT